MNYAGGTQNDVRALLLRAVIIHADTGSRRYAAGLSPTDALKKRDNLVHKHGKTLYWTVGGAPERIFCARRG
jgi:hypothetical protein